MSRATVAESDNAAAVSTRAVPKLALRSASLSARVASAARVTNTPSSVSADASARSNRFIQYQSAAKDDSTGAAMSVASPLSARVNSRENNFRAWRRTDLIPGRQESRGSSKQDEHPALDGTNQVMQFEGQPLEHAERIVHAAPERVMANAHASRDSSGPGVRKTRVWLISLCGR